MKSLVGMGPRAQVHDLIFLVVNLLALLCSNVVLDGSNDKDEDEWKEKVYDLFYNECRNETSCIIRGEDNLYKCELLLRRVNMECAAGATAPGPRHMQGPMKEGGKK